eukprot:m51a1_g7418 hypothetical protein (148) ;mRNA; r:230066-230789
MARRDVVLECGVVRTVLVMLAMPAVAVGLVLHPLGCHEIPGTSSLAADVPNVILAAVEVFCSLACTAAVSSADTFVCLFLLPPRQRTACTAEAKDSTWGKTKCPGDGGHWAATVEEANEHCRDDNKDKGAGSDSQSGTHPSDNKTAF